MSNTSTPPDKAVTTLPVIASVKESYRLVFSNLWAVPAAVFLPLAIYLIWSLFVHYAGAGQVTIVAGQPVPVMKLSLLFASFLVQLFAANLLYIAWHRLTLLGPVDGRPRFLYPIERRHWRFFANSLLVVLIIVITTFLLAFILRFFLPRSAMLLLLTLVYIALLVKLSFVFPAIAVDEKYRLRHAWKQSHGQELRLLTGFVLCFLPAVLLSVLVNWSGFVQVFATGQSQTASPPFLLAAFVTVFSLLNGLAVISFLSIAFKTCTGWVPEAPEQQEIQPWQS